MRFSFEVGRHETHRIEFSWGKFLGVAKIRVDGELVLQSKPLALRELSQLSQLRGVTGSANYLGGMATGSGRPPLTAGWSFEVGHRERHVVHVQKDRPLILAALRPHTYRVFVDGQLVQEHVG